MNKPSTIILGGGLAGLSAAHQLGDEAKLYEQHDGLGGLCQQVVVDGFRFDAVPHVLHFQHEATRLWVSQLLDGRLQRFARHAGVYSHGTYIRYPFQAGGPSLAQHFHALLQGRPLAFELMQVDGLG